MEVSVDNYLSINEIIADVLPQVNDEEMRIRSYGFYKSLVKRALDELGFETFFLEVVKDIDKPDNLIIDIPAGCFNLKQIHGIVGTSDDIKGVANIYWKKGMRKRGKNMGTTADVMPNTSGQETFYDSDLSGTNAHYFTIQNGKIFLSDSCDVFDLFRLTFSGIPSKNLEEAKIVPPYVREAVILFTVNRAAAAMRFESNFYRSLWVDTTQILDEYGFNGAWQKAKIRLKEMDTKIRKDIQKYVDFKPYYQ